MHFLIDTVLVRPRSLSLRYCKSTVFSADTISRSTGIPNSRPTVALFLALQFDKFFSSSFRDGFCKRFHLSRSLKFTERK